MEGHVIKKVKILEAAASESFLPLICSQSHTCFNCLSVFSIKRNTIYLSITQCFTNVRPQKTIERQATALLMFVKYNIKCSKQLFILQDFTNLAP